MAIGFKAEDGAFKAAASSFEEHRLAYEVLRNQLDSEVTGVENDWRGQAAKAFQDAAERWKTDSHATLNALEDIEEKIRQADSEYQSTEADNAAALDLNW